MGLWCLTTLSIIVAFNFIGGENGVPGENLINVIYVIKFDKKYDMKMLIHEKEITRLVIIAWDLYVTQHLKLYECLFCFCFFQFDA